ncbi:MAG TPA: hypothetical protein VH208_03145, partial [Myxococcaceae bacterium]|nr:hypothetical protein [Myxococcaceae bacterium]
PKPDPVRLVVEYMRATGALGAADPPALDADFYAALDATSRQPINEDALKTATALALQKKAYPAADQERLLTGKVLVAQQEPLLVVDGPPQALTTALRKAMSELQGTPLPADAPEPKAAPPSPKPGKKKAPAPAGPLPTGPVAASGVKTPLTADEIRSIRDLAFGKNPQGNAAYARWSRVADAVEKKQLVFGDLNDVPGQADLNAVKADLRWMARDFDIGLGIQKRAFAQPADRFDRMDALPRQLVDAGQPMKVFIPEPRASQGEVQAMLGRLSSLAQPTYDSTIGKDALRTLISQEPIAALRVVGANVKGLASPMNSDRIIESALTADELRGLAQIRFGGPGAQGSAAWERVARAIDDGRVQLTDLNDPVGGTPLDADVKAVKAELRQIAKGIQFNVAGAQDAAGAALERQAAKYNPINSQPDPMRAAQAVVADHLGAKGALSGTLTQDDFGRLDRLAQEFGQGKLEGSEAFVKAWGENRELLGRVSQALQQKRLTYTFNRVRTNPRDPVLEAEATTALALFVQGAEVLQRQARLKNAGWSGEVQRTTRSVLINMFTLPARGDETPPNSVEDWTVMALKAEMASKGKAPDVSISATLRSAGQHVDSRTLQDILGQEKLNDDQKEAVLKAIQGFDSGALQPWDVKGGGEGESKLQTQVDAVIGQLIEQHRRSMTTVDGAFLRYLVEQHGDLLGRSNFETALSGQPSPGMSNADAKKLLM